MMIDTTSARYPAWPRSGRTFAVRSALLTGCLLGALMPSAAAAQEAAAPVDGYVTTHVLDAAQGRPAAGMQIDLFSIDGESRSLVRTVETNADGRTDEPVIPKGELATGVYELVFHAGSYLEAAGLVDGSPLFLDVIPIRFGIADAGEHYHVPLLLSPYSYSTYRGS
jgi:5-hydroxyisourate hydrolase